MARLHFLGSGDSHGVPRWWCECEVCTEARTIGENTRSRPSVLIENAQERILVDASPDLRTQCDAVGVREFDAVLITHAHADHIQGLSDIANRARVTGQACPIYMPLGIMADASRRFHYLLHEPYIRLTPIQALETTQRPFAGYRLSHHKVPHGHNGHSYAFRFESRDGAWGYMPDCLMLDHLEPWYDLDLLVLGVVAENEGKPLSKRSIYSQSEALELIAELKPRHTVFTHMSHLMDVRRPAPKGVCYAHDGLSLELPTTRTLEATD